MVPCTNIMHDLIRSINPSRSSYPVAPA